jgi:hypothetical protein
MELGTLLIHPNDLDQTHPTSGRLSSPLQLLLMFD